METRVAPIALHPDPLIAIILPASVYPLEIVRAARFVKDTNNISKVDTQPWDDNVKALAKFPAMIQTMNDDLTWTMDLGQAFLDQQKELMDTIQALRAKANSAGVLKTTPQQVIVVTNTIIQQTVQQQIVYVTNTIVQIQPSNPQFIRDQPGAPPADRELWSDGRRERRGFVRSRAGPGRPVRPRTQPITLTNLPPDYLEISSGLGKAAPVQAVAWPVVSQDTLLGVLEIATFRAFNHNEKALLEELLPVVAVSMEILARNLRTQELLGQTQEQARQLEEQTEE